MIMEQKRHIWGFIWMTIGLLTILWGYLISNLYMGITGLGLFTWACHDHYYWQRVLRDLNG